MAGESLYTAISQFVPIIYEAALRYAETTFIAQNYVSTLANLRGMETRSVTEYQEKGVSDNLGELDSLSTARQTMDRYLRASLTPKEIGKQIYLTYRRLDTDPEDVLADAARELGYTMGKKIETDILANMVNLAGGQIGTTSGSMTIENLFKARALLERRNIMAGGGYVAMLDPIQYLDIHKDLTDLSKGAPLSVRDVASNSYYVTRMADIDIVVSPNLPRVGTANEAQTVEITGTPTGGTFRLSFYGIETADLAHNISAANLKTALEAVPTIGAGNIASVTLAGSTHTITFGGALAGMNVPLLKMSDNSLSGGTNPSTTILQTVKGSGYSVGGLFTPEAIAFDVRRALLLEPERRPDMRAWELNASAIYATGVWRADYGVQLISKTENPD